jgi:hypothetical protein
MLRTPTNSSAKEGFNTMTRNQGVPKIDSELQIALALLQWTPRQFCDFAGALGHVIPLNTLEDALSVSVERFAQSETDVFARIHGTLLFLGIGFAQDVFGVTCNRLVRLEFPESCPSAAGAIGALLQNLQSPQITIAVQKPTGRRKSPRSLTVMIETAFGTTYIYDGAPVLDTDPEAILSLLYATNLSWLSVVTGLVEATGALLPEVGIARLLPHITQPARSIPRSRVLQLLTGELP